ncbi:MAG: hypothetical protein AB2A00_30655 [Myxococcota bacterium]
MHRRAIVGLLLPAAVVLFCQPARLDATPLARFLHGPALAMVELFSGLPIIREVPFENLSVKEAREKMQRELEEETAQVDLVGQGTLMERFGFVPPGTQLKEAILGFMEEQAAAFYSPKTGRFYNVERFGPLDALGESVTVAHELTHAAQDQALGLGVAMAARGDDDDRTRALQWAMEGHATVVGNRAGGFLSAPFPGPPGVALGEGQTFLMWTPVMTEAMKRMGSVGAAAAAPAFIRDGIFTSYVAGSRFVWQTERVLGREHNLRVICRPPQSTEQAMHVEKYLRRMDPPVKVSLPALAGAPRVELTMGEWAIAWLLHDLTQKEDAGVAAEGWGGDRMALYPDGSAAWRIVMDDERSARRLHAALEQHLMPRLADGALLRQGREIHVLRGDLTTNASSVSGQLAGAALGSFPADPPPPPGSACAQFLKGK